METGLRKKVTTAYAVELDYNVDLVINNSIIIL